MHLSQRASTLILTTILLSGCDGETTPENMQSGEELYNYYCKNCHELKGPGANMERYTGEKNLKPYKVMLMIKFNKASPKHGMTTFTQLSDNQAEAVSEYMVNLIERHLNR